MLRLKTFGGLILRNHDGAVVEHVQRRRMALLAILAAAGESGVSRDRLLLHLWSENDQEHGRANLRQALHALRRDLKAPDLFLGGADLRINPEVLGSDVCDFQDLLQAGELEQAVARHSGPFLDGVHLSDAPEFDRWAEERRGHFARQAAGAIEALATRAAAQGDHPSAARWWGRLLAMDPLDGRVTVALMEAMAAAGNPAGALQQARVHEHLMREEVGAEPNPDVLEAAERIRTAPPRSSRPVRVVPDVAPAAAAPDEPAHPPAVPPEGRLRHRSLRFALALAVGLAGFLFLTGRANRSSAKGGAAEGEVVMIAPFRVEGADSALEYLGEGMMDLLAARFTGNVGPRAASPRTVMARWDDARDGAEFGDSEAREVARRLGAHYLVQGSVVGTPRRLALTGSLVETADGRVRARASVTGSEDSLQPLVDRLAGRLLVAALGEGSEESRPDDALPSTSLEAVRAYLEGQAAYRRGHYGGAMAAFERALEIDSTFALAALRLAMTGYWIRGAAWTERLDLAWRYRGGLSRRERVLLDAIAGPNYPATAWWSEDLAAAERAVATAPDRPEAWFLLGDVLFHLGPGLGLPGAWRDAESAFRRAVELDSSFTAPLEHLLELAAATGSDADVRRIAGGSLLRDSLGEHADFLRWRTVVALGDTLERRRMRVRFERMPVASLLRIVGTGQLEGLATADVDAAAAALARRASARPERWLIGRTLHYFALNRGRVAEAVKAAPLPAEGEPVPRWAERLTVLDALFGDGDTLEARRAAARLAAGGRAAAGSQLDRAARNADHCVLELWRLLRRSPAGPQEAIALLRRPAEVDSIGTARSDSLCAVVLEAIHRHEHGDPAAPDALRALDSVMRLGPAATNDVETFANLVVARLFEAQGDPGAALVAIRRRPHQWAYGPIYLSTFLYMEHRLAAATGDVAGARRAARHYLALRTEPDPSLADEVAGVRGWLERQERSTP